MTIPVIINNAGGSARLLSDQALADAFADAGLSVAVQRVAPADLAEALAAAARQAAASGVGLLVAGGGDGTLNSAARAAVAADVALGILPLGTRNHFAQDLGLPLDPLAAARAIAEQPERAVDLGWLLDHPFLNNVSIGVYPMAVKRRDGLIARLGLPKTIAMVLALGTVLRRPPQLHATLTTAKPAPTAEGPAQVTTPLLFIGNNRYGANALAPQRRARLDEGRLLVLAPGPLHRLPLARLVWHALTGELHDSDTLATWWTGSVTIEARHKRRFSRRVRRLAVGIDGERLVLQPPLQLRCQRGGLRVRAPLPDGGTSAAP